MRRLVWLLLVAGCSMQAKSGGDDPPPDPKGWTITVDTQRLDRYVQPETSTSWTIEGGATATEGLASIEVAGSAVEIGDGGAFTSSVPVMPGLTRVPILVRDQAGHERKADRTLLAARFLPDGAHNRDGAALVLDDAILGAMGEGLVGQAGDVNVAAEIMARSVLSQDDRCVTWPVQASQGTVNVELEQDRGNLWLHITIPNLYVGFRGQCRGAISTIPLAGEMGGTIHVWSRLDAKPPANGQCLDAFAHTLPEVQIAGWGFDVWGTGGPLQSWIVSSFSGDKSAEAKAQISTEVGARANQMLDEKLASISVFDRSSELELLGRPVSLHLCIGALEKIGETLVARIATSATGPGGGAHEAPGAPQIDGAMPAIGARELVLDANVIGQLLYASWRDGGLAKAAPDADIGVLQILVPELATRWPDASTAKVTVDAELPPLVRASTTTNDLVIELGDLMIDLSIEGTRIFRFGVHLTLVLDLVPSAGKLSPTVINVIAEVALLDELFDGPDTALEQAVKTQIGSAVTALLGDTAIALPDLPGLGAPTDVVPVAGGRYLRVKL